MQIKSLRDIYRIRMFADKPVLLESLLKYPADVQPHVEELTRSGRYDILSVVPSSYSNGQDIHYTTKRPHTAVEFHARPKRPEQPSWYDPEISELHSTNPGENFERLHAKLKPHSGYSSSIEASGNSDTIYRGMSQEEYQNILHTGVIKSRGNYNMDGQEGLTYFSTDPSTAQNYAHNFAPVEHKATGVHKAYVIGIKNPGNGLHIAGTGEHEVGIPGEIPAHSITEIHEGRAFAAHPGDVSLHREWGDSKLSRGSSSAPTVHIAWKKIK